jgi:hypothetical protein
MDEGKTEEGSPEKDVDDEIRRTGVQRRGEGRRRQDPVVIEL